MSLFYNFGILPIGLHQTNVIVIELFYIYVPKRCNKGVRNLWKRYIFLIYGV